MKARTVAVVERESYVLENKTGLVFVRKIQIYYVKYRTYLNNVMRSFCVLLSEEFTSGYVWKYIFSLLNFYTS